MEQQSIDIGLTDMVWFGMVCSGLVLSGQVWSGLVWSGLIWSVLFVLFWFCLTTGVTAVTVEQQRSNIGLTALVWFGILWSVLVWPGFVLVYFRSGPVRSGPVRSGQVRSGPVRSGPVRSGPVRSGPVRSGPVWSGLDWSGLVWSGPVWFVLRSIANAEVNDDGRCGPQNGDEGLGVSCGGEGYRTGSEAAAAAEQRESGCGGADCVRLCEALSVDEVFLSSSFCLSLTAVTLFVWFFW